MSEERTTLFEGTASGPQHHADHGGHRVAAALEAHGVDTIFTLCGGHVLHVLDGCLERGIRVVDTRHEQGAGMAATGYAYATRRTGVAAVTAGPGFTNAVTAMADANASGVPLVVIGGRTPTTAWKRGAIQDVDQLAIAASVSKWSATCHDPARLGEYVSDAFRRAAAPPAGAAYLELPTDVLLAEGVPAPSEPASPIAPPQAAPETVEQLVAMLRGATRPVVLVGSGAFWGRADDALLRFAETTRIPVTTTGPARGLLPDEHPGCLGGLVHGGLGVVSADVVVVLGSRFDGNLLYGGPPLFSEAQRIVQVDVDADGFGHNREPDLAVWGDAGAVLEQVTDVWDGPGHDDWLAQAREMADASRASWSEQAESSADGVHPGLVAREVNAVAQEVSDGRCTIVCDGGDILTWGIAYADASGPGRILTTGTSLGTLGVGVPFGVGAKAARPDEPVFVLVGDGSFGLSAMELDTAARHGLPIVCVVSNNGSWGDVRYEQEQWFGEDRLVASGIEGTRYEMLAEMVGGFGAVVEDPDELRPTLRKAAESGRVAVVSVSTDAKIVSEILRGISQLGVM